MKHGRLRCVCPEGELTGMKNVLDRLRIDELRAKIAELKARLDGSKA
jgi:hypothetical protein